jgi:hypothetical protein
MSYKDAVKKVASSINMSPDTVDRIYKYYWLFIRDQIESLQLKEDISEEVRTSFNIPSLGKLALQKNIKEIKKYIKEHVKDKDD